MLGINLLAVIYLLVRPESTPPPPVEVTEAPAQEPMEAQRPAATTTLTRAIPAPSARPPSTSVAGSAIAAEPVIREEPVAANRLDDAPDGTLPAEAAPATRQAVSEADIAPAETWLTFEDVRAGGSLGLPDMHIDLHVYSSNPAERFVFINMNEYREQDTTEEGPRLQRITPEGALLEYRGSTFLLARD